MKLNQDCVRDLLLYLESNLKYDDDLTINNLKLKDYSTEELLYTTEKLKEAGYINYTTKWNLNNLNLIIVSSLTYQGHQFLDTVRDNKIWKQTKSKSSQLASVSLSILQELASSFIKLKLGLS